MSTTVYVLLSGFERRRNGPNHDRRLSWNSSVSRPLFAVSIMEVLYERDANAVRCLWFM